ncbi:retinol dehydrogenase 12-like isoform X2 [Ischnura elegans]|nr:retinol dehydrogenase 12-like isoform X2 [Ischnura elegans]XP_046401446.1 retinol dehydrogenase 12-like isoform X2 [Ischnura elegans]
MWALVAVSCVASAFLYLIKRSFSGGRCRCTENLTGKVIIITGANSGIGRATALELARRGAHLVLACRDLCEGERTKDWLSTASGNKSISTLQLDLNSFGSIEQFVKSFKLGYKRLYALVNNAGVFYHPKTLTEDGYDITFQTNYLGPFYLTNLLLDTLIESAPSRIVNVASDGHRLVSKLHLDDVNFETSYDYFSVYGHSKLCLILFTKKLAGKLCDLGVTVDAVDPGNVETNIFRHFPYLNNPILFAIQKPIRLLVIKTPEEGAQSVIHAVLRPTNSSEDTGKYICNCKEAVPSELACRKDLMEELWEKSFQMCKIKAL